MAKNWVKSVTDSLTGLIVSEYRIVTLGPDTTATTIGLAVSIYYILKHIRGGVVGYSTRRVTLLSGIRPMRHKG